MFSVSLSVYVQSDIFIHLLEIFSVRLRDYSAASGLLHLDHFVTKDATFYKSNASEIWFQWDSQPDTLIPLSEVLGWKPRKLLLLVLVLHWKVLFRDPTHKGSKLFILSDLT